jgi:hypothetical protein
MYCGEGDEERVASKKMAEATKFEELETLSTPASTVMAQQSLSLPGH